MYTDDLSAWLNMNEFTYLMVYTSVQYFLYEASAPPSLHINTYVRTAVISVNSSEELSPVNWHVNGKSDNVEQFV